MSTTKFLTIDQTPLNKDRVEKFIVEFNRQIKRGVLSMVRTDGERLYDVDFEMCKEAARESGWILTRVKLKEDVKNSYHVGDGYAYFITMD